MKKLFIILILFITVPCYGATYYTSEGGTASWPNCTSSCGTGSSVCSLDTINDNITGGNTAILCDDGGDFTTWVIDPANSGSTGNYITYQSENANVVIDANDPDGSVAHGSPIDLRDGQDYIKVIGPMTITNPDNTDDALVRTLNSNNIVINNITGTQNGEPMQWAMVDIDQSTYVEILNSDFKQDGGDVQHEIIWIDDSSKVLLYNTTMRESTHNDLGYSGTVSALVVKNCTFTNKWRSGGGGGYQYIGKLLVDGCTYDHIGWDWANTPWPPASPGSAINMGIKITDPPGILRYTIIDSPHKPLGFYQGGTDDIKYNYIYNNVLYNSVDSGHEWYEGQLVAILPTEIKNFTSNALINNIFAYCTPDPGYTTIFSTVSAVNSVAGNIVANNIFYDDTLTSIEWGDGTYGTVSWHNANSSGWSNNLASEPQMISPSTDDFRLYSSSPGRDAGTYLTEVNDGDGCVAASEDCTIMVVDDAGFFFSETTWDIPDTTGVIESDWIWVDNPTGTDFKEQISTINYTTNTITLVTEHSFEDGADVYHCRDGVCFNGTAPDIGALEYVGIEAPPVDYGKTKILRGVVR